MLKKCVLTVLELNWNKRLGHNKTKLNICYHRLTSSTQLQNISFHVEERMRMSMKYPKMKNARAKRAIFHFQICKSMTFLLPSSSCLLKDQNGKQIITLSPHYSHSVNEQSTYNPGKYKLLGRPFKLLKNAKNEWTYSQIPLFTI